MKYDLSGKSILEKQIEQMKNSSLIHETYFHKRPVFSHEGEYRLLIVDNNLSDAEELASSGVKHKIKEWIKDKEEEEIIDYLTEKIIAQRADWGRIVNHNIMIQAIDDLNEFVDGIMVHPLAEQWYVDIVEEICSFKKIKFDGQSQIYKLVK